MDLVRTDPAWIDAHGVASRGRDCLASMGIYLFNRQTLVDLLTKTDYHDFGNEIFPASIRTHKVQMHLFDGYWEDIGTIRSFYQANLALAAARPAVRSGVGRAADLHAAAISGPLAHRRGHDPQQPDRRRLRYRRRSRDRKQRRRPALPDRPQRHDPQFGHDGGRLLRIARRPGGRPMRRGDRRWASATARSSTARSSTRTAASAATCASPTSAAWKPRTKRRKAMIARRHRGRAEGCRSARRLVVSRLVKAGFANTRSAAASPLRMQCGTPTPS